MRTLHTFVALVLALGLHAVAQERMPVIVVEQPPGNAITKPMRLARVDTDVKISGLLADTTVQMTFANPNGRVLAGDLYFPLPEGATICGYALDIEGKMVDGVVVEKEKAREVFEKVVRQGLDPGLVEWSGGNHFKTRVFPIPAHGSRTIRIRYIAELLPEAGAALFALPMNYKQAVDEFKLRVEVLKSDKQPEVRGGDFANFAFKSWNDSYVAETIEKDRALTNNLVIGIPDVARRAVATETNPDGETYFCLQDMPSVAPAGSMAPPRSIVALWDASGSRSDAAGRAREIALLKQYLATLRGEVLVRLRVFRNAMAAEQLYRVTDGEAPDLLRALRELDYDGGTQLSAISPHAGDEPDIYLLSTDGISNFGESKPGEFTRPLFAFSADGAAEHARLRALAARSGGEYFNLNTLNNDAVVPRIGRSGFGFLRARFDAAKIAACYPASPRPVAGRFALAGKLLADQADVTLEYGVGGKVTSTKRFTVRRSDGAPTDILRPYWAQKKLDELLTEPDANEAEITATGKAHGLVTPGTSLIVLDTAAQYIEHRIRPPVTLPVQRKQYDEAVAKTDKEKRRSDESKIERVLRLWNERVAWWEKKYDYPKDFKYRENEEPKPEAVAAGGEVRHAYGGHAGSVSRRMVDGVAAARPAATAAPAMEMDATTAPPAPAAPRITMALAAAKSKADAADGDNSVAASIEVKPWDPKTPYLKALKAAKDGDAWRVYMTQRAEFGKSPAFFIDCANFFLERERKDKAIQVLSNVAELELENAALQRVLAYRLLQMGVLDEAIRAFEEAKKLRPEEPQSFRDLALACARRAEEALKAGNTGAEVHEDFRRAIDLLYHVVLNTWDRFDEIELTALMELNRLFPIARKAGVDDIKVDARLIRHLDLDTRIVMTWDTDLTDMDLWVTEPSGEKAYYGHNRTTIGGMVSKDFTQGYGPEEYLLRRAMEGAYKIEANFYGSGAPQLIGAVTLQLDIFTNYGRENEQRRAITIRLTDRKETFPVGEVTF